MLSSGDDCGICEENKLFYCHIFLFPTESHQAGHSAEADSRSIDIMLGYLFSFSSKSHVINRVYSARENVRGCVGQRGVFAWVYSSSDALMESQEYDCEWEGIRVGKDPSAYIRLIVSSVPRGDVLEQVRCSHDQIFAWLQE